jgi:hypothetical protein
VEVVEVSDVKEVACLYFLVGTDESLSMLSQCGRFPLREAMAIGVRAVGCCRLKVTLGVEMFKWCEAVDTWTILSEP